MCKGFPVITAPSPSREKQPFKSRGSAGKAGRASCPSQLAGQGLPFPSLDQQRAPEACERGDSAKEDKRRGRNTKSAQLDGVKFPSHESHREQGSGVLLPRGWGQFLEVQQLQVLALEPGIQQENSVVGFGFFLSHSQKDRVRLAWHVTEWVGKPFCLKRRKCHPVANHKH